MASNIRDILPRLEIRKQDRIPGRYPTVQRTGDASRRGNNRVFFDDTYTVVYAQSVSASFPTTLGVTSRYLQNDLTSSIIVGNTNITKASEQFIEITPQSESFRPFTEHNQIVQDIKELQFYKTGSEISEVGAGFTRNLGSKTIIKIPIEIGETTLFLSNSFSDATYYYNRARKRFEQKTNVTIVPASLADRRPFGPYPGAQTPIASPLFNAFGIPQSDYYSTHAGSFSFTTYGASAGTLLEFNGSTILTNASAAPTSSQFLDISSYIHAPFLLEKAHLELPFSSSTGWYNAPTAHSILDGNIQLSPDQTSVGGPCVTFALLNNINTTHREIICSGTIVPERDCSPWFEQAVSIGGLYRTLNGFTSLSTPGFRVPSADFNGSAKLFMPCAQTHGKIFEGSNIGAGTKHYSASATSQVPSVAPWGRGQAGVAGRSVFGGEYALKSEVNLRAHASWSSVPGSAFLSGDYYLINGTQTKYSPYLINPKDNLVAHISVGHTAMRNDDQATPAAWVASSSFSHAGIPTGTAYLTLFGSFIKNNSEFHDTLNQRLETNEIHECVGNDPVLDQFDIVSNYELSGTFLDRFNLEQVVDYLFYGTTNKISSSIETKKFYSSFTSVNDQEPWCAQKAWMSGSVISTLKRSLKNSTLLSDETYWDSRIPVPNQVIKTYNSNFKFGAASTTKLAESTGATINAHRMLATGNSSDYLTGSCGINDWIVSFPFEPKNKDISTTFANVIKGSIFDVYGINGIDIVQQFCNFDAISVEYGSNSAAPHSRKIAGEFSSGQTIGLGTPEFIKFFYGIGDGHGDVDNNHVEFKNVASNGVRTTAAIRGWKHGIISGFPTLCKSIWRRDKFGMPRDMLEQRLDAKFFVNASDENKASGVLTSPILIKFVDSAGSIVAPETTYSSNLSFEATSSLPYFDGTVRNREEPLSLVNQSIVVI